MGSDPKVEAPNELVVEGILEAQGPDRRIHTDACAKAVATPRLAARPSWIPQHRLPAVQVCAIVKEQRALRLQPQSLVCHMLYIEEECPLHNQPYVQHIEWQLPSQKSIHIPEDLLHLNKMALAVYKQLYYRTLTRGPVATHPEWSLLFPVNIIMKCGNSHRQGQIWASGGQHCL